MTNQQTALAGKQHVVTELCRRGVEATASSDSQRYNQVVINPVGDQRTIRLRVKTKRARKRSANWQGTLRDGWKNIVLSDCSKIGDCPDDCTPSLNEPVLGKRDYYWVFVSLLNDGGQSYYIVPDSHVREHMIRNKHLAYLNKNRGQRPRKNHNSLHLSFDNDEVEKWKGRWDVLGLALELRSSTCGS